MSKRSEIGQMSLFGAEEIPVAEKAAAAKKAKVAAQREKVAPKKTKTAKSVSKNDKSAAEENISAVEKSTETPKTPKILPDYDHTKLFERLAKSEFRQSFHLEAKDRAYIKEKGINTIQLHAEDFVEKRLAPAYPHNDGSQTPMRGHPVFRAQHATGCCCRGCFEKWHHIPAGRPLTEKEQLYAVSVLMNWIRKEMK